MRKTTINITYCNRSGLGVANGATVTPLIYLGLCVCFRLNKCIAGYKALFKRLC